MIENNPMRSEETAILNWVMTNVCNYDCHYCFGREKGGGAETIPAASVVSCLRATGRHWKVNMVGGEVMLIPKFVEQCVALIDVGMRITVETNLSVTRRVVEFAENVDPKKVDCVYISTHIEEREKKSAVSKFVGDISLLRCKGFTVYVNYVLHPSLISRFQADQEFFASRGIQLRPAPFIGIHAGANYPDAYTKSERRVILAANPDAGKHTGLHTQGLLCGAGRDFAVLDTRGTFYRCHGVREKLGTIKDGLQIHERASSCPVRTCPCWGYHLLVDRKAAERCANRFRRPSVKVMLRSNSVTRPFYRWIGWVKHAVFSKVREGE